ncbi:MAG: hypothetical protein KAH21_06565 [Spirochaetaceae bacterium]|nr:hypothetical protein [Spirochaetaceae bacterium]
MSRISTGRGKLILFGEHAAVYGYPAVGTPLPCLTEIRHIDSDSTTSTADRVILQELFEKAGELTSLKIPPDSDKWELYSNVPRTGGFGSSAALCVAVSKIVLNRYSNEYDQSVHILANQLERRFHGTPSGIDTGMASDTGVAAWYKNGGDVPEREPLTIPEWFIIFGALPRTMPTADSVMQLRRLKESGDSSVTAGLKELGSISSDFISTVKNYEHMKSGFPLEAAELANQAQKVLSSLNFSTDELDTLLNLARREGALGGKLSGGGMGGAFYICAPNRNTRNRILKTLPEKIAKQGISLTVPLTAMNYL